MRGEAGAPLAASGNSPPVLQNYSEICDEGVSPQSVADVSPISFDNFQPKYDDVPHGESSYRHLPVCRPLFKIYTDLI